MAEPRNLVLFLGAGFSIPVGVPGMLTIFDAIRDHEVLLADEQRDLDRIIVQCAAMASLIGENARNVESIASFLSLLELCQPDFTFQSHRGMLSPKGGLELLLRAIVRAVNPPGLGTTVLAKTAHFLDDLLKAGVRLTVITTNYDLHLELASLVLDLVHHHGLTPFRLHQSLIGEQSGAMSRNDRPLYANPGDADAPLLLKLHGSVNWHRGKVKGRDGVLVVRQADARENTRNSARGRYEFYMESSKLDERPVIIAPTILKPQVPPEISAQWQAAATALDQADHLWFIGYSFPESDSYMRYFLASSLAQNARLRQILIVDPSREVCQVRGPRQFASGQHSSIVRPIPAKWQELGNPAELLK